MKIQTKSLNWTPLKLMRTCMNQTHKQSGSKHSVSLIWKWCWRVQSFNWQFWALIWTLKLHDCCCDAPSHTPTMRWKIGHIRLSYCRFDQWLRITHNQAPLRTENPVTRSPFDWTARASDVEIPGRHTSSVMERIWSTQNPSWIHESTMLRNQIPLLVEPRVRRSSKHFGWTADLEMSNRWRPTHFW